MRIKSFLIKKNKSQRNNSIQNFQKGNIEKSRRNATQEIAEVTGINKEEIEN